jgi:hypothetical protein
VFRRGSALAFVFMLAVTVMRLGAPSSALPDASRKQGPAETHTGSRKSQPPPARAPNFSGGCTAYLPEMKSHPQPYDENLGDAKKVLDKFFASETPFSASNPVPQDVRYVVALAPDPRHTNLGFLFDRELSLLLQAAQDEGYDYDSSWLPWREHESQALTYLADQQYATELTEEREACPGVLLFRKRPDPTIAQQTADASYQSSLMVFVVGEQATGGINEYQWSNAVAWLATYASPRVSTDQNSNDGVFRLLGPTFTGSLVSLERGLTDAYTKNQKFQERFPDARILSGSVTGCSAIHWFESHLPVPVNKEHRLYFGTFQENDDLHIFRFLDYLKGNGTEPGDVAILSEDETAYAAHAMDNPLHPANDPCSFPYARENRPVNLVYPRDISALRDAYQEQSVFDSSGLRLKEHQHAILHESAGQVGPTDDITDSLPSFSGSVTAIDQESYLYGLVDFLRAHHTRYLVLRCTNPLDSLFLTRFFHRAHPDARIVTVGSDLLFRREIDTTEFRGVLTLSSYPLLPREQHWSAITEDDWGRLGHNHLVFQGHLAEGMYIAMRYLLREKMVTHSAPQVSVTPLIAVQPPGSTEPLRIQRIIPTPGYEDPFWLRSGPKDLDFAHRPPTWLSAVGRDGYWPVAVLERTRFHLDYPGTDESIPKGKTPAGPLKSTVVELTQPRVPPLQHYDLKRSDTDQDAPDPHWSFNQSLLIKLPLPWLVCTFLALALVCYQLWGLAFGGLDPSDGFLSAFRITRNINQSLLLGISCALAIMPLFELTDIYALTNQFDQISGDLRARPAFVLTVFLFLGMILLILARFRHDGWAYGVRAVVVCLVFFGLFRYLYLLTFQARLTLSNGIPLFYRMTHITDGVSPLVPILLLTFGFYLWNWQAMAGNLMLAEGCPTLPKLNFPATLGTLGPAGYRVSWEFGKKILKIANPLYYSWRIIVVPLFFLIAAYFCFIRPRNLPLLSLEGNTFNYTVNGLLLLALLFTVAESLRLYSTWVRLKDLLQALGRLPLRRTFARLRPIEANSVWSVSSNVRRVQYDLFNEQLDAANRLNNLTPFARTSLNQVKLYGETFRAAEPLVSARGRWDLPVRPAKNPGRSMRNVLSEAVGEVFKYLDVKWSQETQSLNLESTPVNSEDEKSDGARIPLSDDPRVQAAEEFIGYHYIAFIQNVVCRMRTITLSMIFLFIAICFAISFYPFVPRTEIGVWLILNLALIGSAVAYVYAGMERDEILSYIANTRPGRLGGEFWLKLSGFLVGPIIGILTTQFPAITDTVLEWLQPGLDALK